MSSMGVGEIVLIPMHLVGCCANLLSGAAVSGGALVVQAGKAVVNLCTAGGRKIYEAVQQHVERQREINRLCEDFEKMVIQDAQVEAAKARVSSRKKIAELINTLASHKKRIAKRAPKRPEMIIPEDTLDEELIVSTGAIFPGDLLAKADSLKGELDELRYLVSKLEGDEWDGLINTTSINEELDNIQTKIEKNRLAGREERVSSLVDIKSDIRSLHYEIIYMIGDAKEKHNTKFKAAQALATAGNMLERKAKELEGKRELESVLAIAMDFLKGANEEYRQGNYTIALQSAEAASTYIEQLTKSIERTRKANIQVRIDGLKEYVEGFGFPPDANAPIPLNDLIQEAQELLNDNKLDACWDVLTQAQEHVDQLADKAVAILQTAQRDIAIDLSRDVLGEMGYMAEEVDIKPNEEAIFTARRGDGANFRIWVSPDGLLRYKTEKFGTTECKVEAQKFFAKLKERGLYISTQSTFNLAEAKDRLIEVLLRQGYHSIEEDPIPDGSGTILTASKTDEPDVVVSLDHDTNAVPDLSPEHEHDQEILEHIRLVQENRLQHFERMNKYMQMQKRKMEN